MIIAIDGHSSCGKSTIAKGIAKQLGFVYVDTGAMYRAVTYFCMQKGLIENQIVNEALLLQEIDSIFITFDYDSVTQIQITYVNGENVEKQIRSLEVANNVSAVSKIPFVRKKLVAMQQEYGRTANIVMDGRDIGTVVFPNAEYKFFITAAASVRAKRRFDELSAKGEQVNFNQILANVQERDFIDSTRAESPLKQAEDAIFVDTSHMTREEQLIWILQKIHIQ